jgi:hypothetical protein
VVIWNITKLDTHVKSSKNANLQNHSDIHSISIGNEYTISIVDIELIDDENLYKDGIPSFENDDQDLSKADQHIVEGTSDAAPQSWQRKWFQYYITH